MIIVIVLFSIGCGEMEGEGLARVIKCPDRIQIDNQVDPSLSMETH